MFMRYLGGGVGHVGYSTSPIHWKASDTENVIQSESLETHDNEPIAVVDSDEELDDMDDSDEIESEDADDF